MTQEGLIVFGGLAATVALFLSDRLRLDVVALLALLALTLTGMTPAEPASPDTALGVDDVLTVKARPRTWGGRHRTSPSACGPRARLPKKARPEQEA
ncbi:MAG TPA: hypothetical protein PKD53_27070 [Chloroflexaceae bacterium]|nr:hypothetical protein [Chloroflexaceae bacterium]